LTALLVIGVVSLLSSAAHAQDVTAAESRRVRFAIAGGFDVWGGLSDLRPLTLGEFDDTGFVVDFAAHWRMRQWGTERLLLGFDLGFFSHDSDVFHVREDVTARGMYLTPSLKWQLDTQSGPRYSLDFGLGYYSVDITEVDTSSYYGYYCCYWYYEEQLWEDSSFGGFIGTTFDFGDAGRRRGGGFTMGAKIHWLDLGNVRDELRFRPQDTLGPNAGRLRGPIYALQFGYRF
jgi:hypothetical protein